MKISPSKMAWLAGATFAAACATSTSCGTTTAPASADADTPLSSRNETLGLIRALTASRPFRADGVSKLTGHRLLEVAAESNGYFSVLASRDEAHPLFSAVELRVPRARSTESDGLMILTLQKTTCIDRKEVTAQFGGQPETSFPSAHAPPEAPEYLVYRMPWGTLSFGFARGGRECLTNVVLDATGK